MKYVLDQTFLPEKYFEEICQYPHGSFHEKPLSDHIVAFAQEHNLEYIQDEIGNVIIYKKGSKGYEDHEPVMLEAHMDMVCEKDPESDHDFAKDPIDIYVEDGLIKARGTTLGGDDGLGVAYMMAILDDETAVHPPLECVFTVQEEVGCLGAAKLDYSKLKARRMLGLDNMGDEISDVASDGSERIVLSKDVSTAACDLPFYKLEIKGLLGGHSAGYIAEERGNSIKIAARILYYLTKDNELYIAEINGGDKDNAIPVYCKAIFVAKEEINERFEKIRTDILNEFRYSDKDLTITLSPAENQEVLSRSDSKELIDFLLVFPNGFRHKSLLIKNLTSASENLARISTDNGKITIRNFYRAAAASHLDEMRDEMIVLAEKYGYDYTVADRAPSWLYNKESGLRKLLAETYEKISGKKLIEKASHGGLETSFIAYSIPGIDIACLGALCENYHTVRETLDLKSFRRNYTVLKEVLKQL